ncbi:putative glutathione S-transferase [Leptodontidium sp. 2 PMI_412]|nr:putative glutathione S-transferase [Leptodontidium sp. 2 PMI_412]
MGLKLYGFAQSICTRRVIATLAEKGITNYEFCIIDLAKGAQKLESYVALQPFGKVPVLDDNGLIVYESRAICKYLAAKYHDQGVPLMPKLGDLKGYALFEQGCSIEQNYFDNNASAIAWERVYKKFRGEGDADEAKVAAALAALDITLTVYEKILSEQAYLAGNEFSLVDLYHLPYGSFLRQIGFQSSFDKYPSVRKWLEGIQARESWKKATSP